jgi:predicted nucleic acid-binding protein
MTVFVDTGVIYAEFDVSANRNETAVRAMNTVYDGEFGQPFTSDYVYDEVVTLTHKRTGRFEAAQTVGAKVRGAKDFPDVYSFAYVDPTVFEAAIDVFERFGDQGLSFTDATTAALVNHKDVDAVLSFDDDFDGIVDRIDPASL